MPNTSPPPADTYQALLADHRANPRRIRARHHLADLRRRAARRDPLEHMAEVMLTAAAADGACTRERLRQAGFAEAEIDSLEEPARIRAAARVLEAA